MRLRIALCSCIALLMVCSIALGQTITGTVTGTVTDASGAVVSGAKITATNITTGIQTPTTTNSAGVYTIRFLQIGQYRISIEAPGFRTATLGPFTLEVAQEARVDAQLTLGKVSENVVVSSAAPILNTENATTGDTITAALAKEVPVQARNFSSLTLLVAGAITPNPSAQNSVGRAAYNGGYFQNGNREQTNNYTLDGADINEAIDNYIGYSPNIDALGEIRVITGDATAEYGNANGGQVVMVTQSGTNQFHGDAFWFLENTNLDANSWVNKHVVDQSAIGPVPTLNRSIFGGTLGGPIFKDRLFFFVDFQGARQHASTTEQRSVPTSAMRQGIIAQPNGKPPIVVRNITNPAAIYLLANPALFPLPNTTGSGTDGVVNDYVGVSAQATHNNQGDIKIDARLTASDSLSGRFSIGRESDGYSRVSLPTDVPSNNSDPYTGFILNWTHIFSSSIVNELRAGYGRTRYIQTPTDVSGQFGLTGNQKLGIPGTQLVPGISTFDLSATENLNDIGIPVIDAYNGAYGGIDSDSIVNAYTYGDNLSWQLGRHTLKFGAQALRYQENRYYSGNDGTLGYFVYSGAITGSSWGDFLSNQAFKFGQGAVTGRWGQRQYRDAFFVQDDFKVKPNLTVNLGLRWEYDQPMYEVNNKEANINLQTGVVSYAGQNGASRALYDPFYGGFMPRIGFSFSPNGFHDRVVLRGGYGITNFLEGTGANLRLTLNPPFFIDSSEQANGTSFFQVQNGFPRPANAATLSGNVRAWDPHLKPALIQQFNLTTEYQVNNSMSFSIAYLGQVGDHLVDPKEGNQAMLPAALTGGKPILPLSKFPNLSAVNNVSFTESEATMNYNALQTTVRQRVAHGLEFLANYTWSKSISNNLGYYGAAQVTSQSAYWQNAYDPKGDNGPAFFDAANIFSFSGYYDLPLGRGRMFGSGWNRITDTLAGGWKLGAVASLHSGFPVTFSSTDAVNANARTARANHYRTLLIGNRSANNWFGTTPSATPCAGPDNGVCAYGSELPTEFGTAGVGTERAPGYRDLDAALSKAFAITEDKHLDFRADFFNVMNTTSLGPPNANVSSNALGQITTTTSTERQIQLALKLIF